MARVLIVDDDSEMRLLLGAVVENLGHETRVAADVGEALKVLESDTVDLVVSDVEMPGLDGLRFLSLLRSEGHDVGVIMTSGRNSVDIAVECLRRGAVAFVEKPLDIARLQREVTVALQLPRHTAEVTLNREQLFTDSDEQGASLRRVRDGERTEPAELPMFRPLTRIGRFEVQGALGRGGFGVVYRCFDPVLKRDLAVKVIPRSIVADEEATSDGDRVWRRFVSEAQAAGALSHPHIATVYDFGFDDAQHSWFMAMELVKGTTLVQRLANGASIAVDDAVVIVHQIADALCWAHERGVIHRDIKPANVMLVAPRFAKLLDFGLARRGGDRITERGIFLGTPSYTAPERFDAFAGDARSDQFSLGVVFHEMLTGRSLFSGESFAETMKNVLQREAPVVERAPPAVQAIIEKLLAKDPTGRYQDEHQLLRDLEAAGAELGLVLHPAAR